MVVLKSRAPDGRPMYLAHAYEKYATWVADHRAALRFSDEAEAARFAREYEVADYTAVKVEDLL